MKRYEREIEEILQKIVDFPSDGNARRRAKRPRPSLWAQIRRGLPVVSLSPTTGNLIAAAVLLAVLGFALRDYVPRIAPFASLVAVALFVVIIAQSFRRRRPRYEKRWRGQVIEFPRKKSSLWNELGFTLTVLWRSLSRWINRR